MISCGGYLSRNCRRLLSLLVRHQPAFTSSSAQYLKTRALVLLQTDQCNIVVMFFENDFFGNYDHRRAEALLLYNCCSVNPNSLC